MSRILFAASALSLTLAAPALADDRQFTHEGVTFTYSTEKTSHGQILVGKSSQGGRFKLQVKDGWVRGHFDGTPVSFPAPKAEKPVVVAAR
jgi:hypothetical protein